MTFFLMLCYCVLHALRHFVYRNWSIKAMCSAILLCCAIQSVQIAVERLRQSFSKGTGSPVLSCDSAWCFAGHCWQIALELLHHGCELNVRICTKQ